MEKLVEILGIPGSIAAVIIGVWIFLQVIGELCELKGKIVPEFFKIRKYFKRKKEEKEKQQQLMDAVNKSLADINAHYSKDNIAKRDAWMNWVDSRAVVYDAALKELTGMKSVLQATKELTLDLYINVNRNRIIDFASKVANENVLVSKEEFNRIFKVHTEYEDILKKHNKTNGEVDVAYRIILEAYEERMKEHTFLEDVRGYMSN